MLYLLALLGALAFMLGLIFWIVDGCKLDNQLLIGVIGITLIITCIIWNGKITNTNYQNPLHHQTQIIEIESISLTEIQGKFGSNFRLSLYKGDINELRLGQPIRVTYYMSPMLDKYLVAIEFVEIKK